jgi:uncharacterized protein (DUF305 family)
LSITTCLTSVLSLMKISLGRISGGVLLSAALAVVASPPASAQDPPPAIVQPGAPGAPTRTLTAEEAAALGRPSAHVEADVRFMQGMIHHHGQALDMTDLHHEGALTMVSELFLVSGAGQEPLIFRFASDVDADQSAEIGRMNTMLQARR